MKLNSPIYKRNFRVTFKERDDSDALHNKLVFNYDINILSRQLVEFRFDKISKEFEFLFRLPGLHVKEFNNSVEYVSSFKYQLFDDFLDGSLAEEINFIIDKFIEWKTDLSYAGNAEDWIDIKLKGIYK